MSSKKLDIMLADDSSDEHFLFRHSMRSVDNNITIYTVPDGVELMKWLNKPDAIVPDILFLDLNMPLKNGRESLAEIRKNEKLSDLAVLIYSTSDEKRDIEETYALGANLYVRKPQDYSELEKTLARLIDMFRHGGIPHFPKSEFVFSGAQ